MSSQIRHFDNDDGSTGIQLDGMFENIDDLARRLYISNGTPDYNGFTHGPQIVPMATDFAVWNGRHQF